MIRDDGLNFDVINEFNMAETPKVSDIPKCLSPLTHDTGLDEYTVWSSTVSHLPSTTTMGHTIGIPIGISVIPYSFGNAPRVRKTDKLIRCTNCRSYLSPGNAWKGCCSPQGVWICKFCSHENDLAKQQLSQNAARWTYGDDPELVYQSVVYEAPPTYRPKREYDRTISFVFFVSSYDKNNQIIDIYIAALQKAISDLKTDLLICIYICTGDEVMTVKYRGPASIYLESTRVTDHIPRGKQHMTHAQALYILQGDRLKSIVLEACVSAAPADTWMFLEYLAHCGHTGGFLFFYLSNMSIFNSGIDSAMCIGIRNKLKNLNLNIALLVVDESTTNDFNKSSLLLFDTVNDFTVLQYYEASLNNVIFVINDFLAVDEEGQSHLSWWCSLRLRISHDWVLSTWLTAPFIKQTGITEDNSLIYMPLWRRGVPITVFIEPRSRSIMSAECHIQCCFLHTNNANERLIEVHNISLNVTRNRDEALCGVRTMEASYCILLDSIKSLFTEHFLDSIRDSDEELLESLRIRIESFLTLKLRYNPETVGGRLRGGNTAITGFGAFLMSILHSTAYNGLRKSAKALYRHRSALGRVAFWRNIQHIGAVKFHQYVNCRLWDLTYENTHAQELPLTKCYIQKGRVYLMQTCTEAIIYVCGDVDPAILMNLLSLAKENVRDSYNCLYLEGVNLDKINQILTRNNKSIMMATSGGHIEQCFMEQLSEL